MRMDTEGQPPGCSLGVLGTGLQCHAPTSDPAHNSS